MGLELEPGSSVRVTNAFNESLWPYLMAVLTFRLGEASYLLSAFQKNLPNSHKDVRSDKESSSEWLLRELKIVQDNFVLDP